jgi:hypothetical protein
MKIRNKYKIWANQWGLGFSGLGIFMILLPGMADIDGMDGGFALKMGGFFMIVVGLITYFVLIKNAKMYRRLANFQNVIARWTVPAAMYKEYAQYDKSADTARFKAMFWMIAVVSLVVGLILILMGLEFGIIAGIILGLIAFIWIVSRIAIWNTTLRSNTLKGDLIIAKEGGIINGNLHNWSQLLAHLVKCDIIKVSDTLQVFEVTYSTLQRTGEVQYTARFPFPIEQIEEIRRVEEVLMG